MKTIKLLIGGKPASIEDLDFSNASLKIIKDGTNEVRFFLSNVQIITGGDHALDVVMSEGPVAPAATKTPPALNSDADVKSMAFP